MARYTDAIEWIAYNDDTEFLQVDDDADMSLSVTASMVADLWNKTHAQIVADLRAELRRKDKRGD